MKKFILPLAIVSLTIMSCKDSSGDASDEEVAEAKKECKDQLKSSLGSMGDNLTGAIDDYCGCAVDAIVEEDIPLEKMKTMGEEEIMEIATDCVEDFKQAVMNSMQEQ